MSVKLPNFIVIGAPKSGTTSLYFYLKQHPDIFLPEQKELHYFTYDILAQKAEGPGDKDVLPALCSTKANYQSHYRSVGSQSAVGEVSPSYLYYHQVAGRIKSALDSVKIIALLRNPIEKAYSQYMHLVREYRETESFYDALMMEGDRRNKNWSDLWLYATSSLYFPGVDQYLSTFGEGKVKIIIAENFFINPYESLKGVFAFLDVDRTLIPTDSKIYNKSGKPRTKLLSDILSKPGRIKFVLRKIIPTRLRDRIWFALLKLNTGKKGEMDQETRRYLSEFFRDDITSLESCLGIQTHWLENVRAIHQ
jgi:hypothetical protein